MPRPLTSYRLLLRWHYLQSRPWLVWLIVVQVALAAGVIYGLGFLVPSIDPTTARYLATGSATMGLLVLGLTVVPAQVTQARLSGTHQYVATLPVPRLAPLAAEVTFWLLVQLPGTVLALVIARLRFDVGLHVGPAVVPAIALTALTAASVGYAVAVSLPPEVANQLTSFLSLGLLLFSPINFPASRLPSVARAIHSVLPVQYMADIVRGSLTGRYVDPPLLAYVVVVAWCVVGLAAGHRAATRRP